MNTIKRSYSRGAVHIPLIEKTLGDFFDDVVARFPDNEALVSCHQNIRLSYSQLQAEVNQLASALIALSLAPGDRVAIWANNSAEWLITQLATAKVGIILVNFNPAYKTMELEYALNKAGCKALITLSAFKTTDYLQVIRTIAPEITTCASGQLSAARLPALHTVIHLGEEQVPGFMRFRDLMSLGNALDERVPRVAATLKNTDAINIQFTSGTTGSPKGAALTHRGILNNGFFLGEGMSLTATDRLCIPVPLFHCFGMVVGNLAALSHASTIVYPNDTFDPVRTLEAVQNERCTALHGVPTMFITELDHPRFHEFDLSTLRTGIMAGTACPIEVMRRVQRNMHMRDVTIAYGMTETSPASYQSTCETPLEKRVSTIGKVHPHLEAKVVHPESGDTVPTGVVGELCIRGYSLMQGYWNDPEKTVQTIDSDGWIHSGDLATMDAEGYVSITGRIKDMVIRGGENISPREIEEFLYQHPAIQDAQVIGVPDEKYGEELCVWVIVRPGLVINEDEIREFCSSQIARYKIPRYIRFVDGFPMTLSGKVQKFRMREIMEEELALAVC
ncbi:MULTISPECIES: AMP-binding protein [unclassified Pseudomonas]|uniref:AMP-binding protein n=1 Tax=unclassified Pseudomonas TaxID=196821 RepID=UPI0015A1A71E|nr:MULTISPECIES: AMP-binding protein [unclassified Pseudomonas]NVZ17633.1 AMP-binding protein [Pseudomonas sp. IPO3775]NWA80439.1 AMP-binding protein [Pseudomonas sp. C8002]